MSIVISQSNIKEKMDEDDKTQKQKNSRKPRKRVKLDESEDHSQQKKQSQHHQSSPSHSDGSDQPSGWSSEIIEPAIKSMAFREKRGTRMKQLIKGKHRKDQFWEKYQNYFGGDLNRPEDSDDQEDYQASSSGRDEFDSDFDLTDSYVGKRGRKKGTKMKYRKRNSSKAATIKTEQGPVVKGKRGRKKKVVEAAQGAQQNGQQLKEEIIIGFAERIQNFENIMIDIFEIKRNLRRVETPAKPGKPEPADVKSTQKRKQILSSEKKQPKHSQKSDLPPMESPSQCHSQRKGSQ